MVLILHVLRSPSITLAAADNVCMAVSGLSGIIMCWYAVKKLLTHFTFYQQRSYQLLSVDLRHGI